MMFVYSSKDTLEKTKGGARGEISGRTSLSK